MKIKNMHIMIQHLIKVVSCVPSGCRNNKTRQLKRQAKDIFVGKVKKRISKLSKKNSWNFNFAWLGGHSYRYDPVGISTDLINVLQSSTTNAWVKTKKNWGHDMIIIFTIKCLISTNFVHSKTFMIKIWDWIIFKKYTT